MNDDGCPLSDAEIEAVRNAAVPDGVSRDLSIDMIMWLTDTIRSQAAEIATLRSEVEYAKRSR